ncbi:hypothetical protein COT93_02045 [Candidatus Falkowbacteria bacterium CG10_big_fil_rev_8_21_14_0_10_37_18]|uniref:Cytoplasmic protein n=1 Tax=Candidatus Falkowbacteria bacterium CG10_big_fil_rev_8_21_14_0_10_37_18 TaxID=1974562 RepID=A0A2H0V8S9_9BACT|nr:MAG: hypothetical protein AUJ26_02810 [Candidatus Falkowbacteria bacterium CG1_02_37_21]PIR95473.1 MAG: hypothetical protein COT93_02045 [Candidatus Falkowbacteria bacterium CG10_big_fil_rev_8_21_14_0_10_37_18]
MSIINNLKYKHMPNLDETGPMGQGAGMGRRMGNCGTGQGMGFGSGMGRGQGCQTGYAFGSRRFISNKNEMASLEYREKALEEELAFIREEKSALKGQEK